MNELQIVQSFLSTAMLDDTRLALASVVAWLDPIHMEDEIEDDLSYADYGEENDLLLTLNVCRRCFPEVYAQSTQLVWQGIDDLSLRRILCEGMNITLVAKLDHIEQVKYGVPIEAMGLCIDDPEFYEVYPDLAAIFADFGLAPDSAYPEIDKARNIAKSLINSLEANRSETLRHVAQLLTWLFSLSGNTLVDMTEDEIWESGMEMPDWTPDDVAFVNAMNLEAAQIVNEAMDGQKTLEADPELRAALQKNIQFVYKALNKEGRRRTSHDGSATPQHLEWPERP